MRITPSAAPGALPARVEPTPGSGGPTRAGALVARSTRPGGFARGAPMAPHAPANPSGAGRGGTQPRSNALGTRVPARPAATSEPSLRDELREFIRSLAVIARELEAVVARVDGLGRRVERVSEPAERAGDRGSLDPRLPGPYERRRRRPGRDETLMAEAERGAHAFTFEWGSDGRARVSVNHSDPFSLPPVLAALLSILASPTGREDGPLAGWKKRPEILLALHQKMGKKVSPRALNQLVYRLRKELATRRVNPHLVQKNLNSDLRFAVRLGAMSGESPAGAGEKTRA